jgi:peptidoglycan/LPS O-acetylase OafA/YrhL
MQHPDRYRALDFLRAVAMLLGIGLHALLAYTAKNVPFWPIHDAEHGPVADLLVYTVHEFRMQTFFLLAGFFACMLCQRYGLAGMLGHRFRRIVIPFVLALLLVQPVLQAIWMMGDPSALRTVGLPEPPPGAEAASFIVQHFASGQFLEAIRPWHLWFLYYLCLLFLLLLPLLWLGRRLAGTRLALGADEGFRRLVLLRGKSFLLAVPLVPLLWGSRYWSVDTPEGWPIQPEVLAYYFIFYAFGWMLYRRRELLNPFAQRWRGALALGNLLFLPVMLDLVRRGLALRDVGETDTPLLFALKVSGIYLGAVYSWLMVGGLTGAFLHFFSRERASVRYLADASYWCYLVHLIPIVLLQMAVAPLAIPGALKFIIVLSGSMVVLLLSYAVGVRYTLIGAILNGRKSRKAAVVDAQGTSASVIAPPVPRVAPR